MKISDLKAGMRRVDIKVKVVSVGEARDVNTKFGAARVATATVADETGQTKLTLWNDDIEKVGQDDVIDIKNGYISEFRGEIQLNVGQYGKMNVLKGEE
jgi:replication factor A1